MGINELAARWTKAGRALRREDQAYAARLAAMAKKHSSESFYALDDPLEAAVFSALIEIMREIDQKREGAKDCGSSTQDSAARSISGAKQAQTHLRPSK
jgi:hypothetical protein